MKIGDIVFVQGRVVESHEKAVMVKLDTGFGDPIQMVSADKIVTEPNKTREVA